MNKLEKAKKVIKDFYRFANCGIYDTRNIAGDTMDTIYEDEGLTIDICYYYSYFEVFGLSDAEFEELEKYYDSLGNNSHHIDEETRKSFIDEAGRIFGSNRIW